MGTDSSPVVVGVGQLLQKGVELEQALDPLTMLTRVARAAAEDAGGGRALLEAIDSISLVDVAGWHPANGPDLLSEAIGASATSHIVTPTGGESGLSLISHAARRIAAGESRVALVGGTNNLKSLMTAIKRKMKLDWPKGGRGTPQMMEARRSGETDHEKKHGLEMPIEFYPLIENALRAHRGTGLDAHREQLGRLFSPFTKVAADNPYAWFPVARSAEEIVTVSATNRMVAYPYTKYLNSIINVDQAACVLLMSSEAARSLGIAKDRCVHWLGGAFTHERSWYVSERSELYRSEALETCANEIHASTGIEMADIDFVDFYSCFPVAVEVACDVYGIAPDDPRGLTVTGGLPYAGGPANNYTTHAVAELIKRLRARPGSVGLATGNGWYLTKHAAAMFSTEPREAPAATGPVEWAPTIVGDEPLEIAIEPQGRGHVEGYTVVYDRDGAPHKGIVMGRLESGARFIANTPMDRALLDWMVSSEFCGTRGNVSCADGLGRFSPL